jgi:hypothetical protein
MVITVLQKLERNGHACIALGPNVRLFEVMAAASSFWAKERERDVPVQLAMELSR